MGVIYCGAYADQVGGYAHEGYAARRLPDGTLTSTWTADTAQFTAYVPCCGCGWRGEGEFPPTDAGEQAALDAWDREHLQPLIDAAAGRGWDDWAARMRAAAEAVRDHTHAGRFTAAVEVLEQMRQELATWATTAGELAEGRR